MFPALTAAVGARTHLGGPPGPGTATTATASTTATTPGVAAFTVGVTLAAAGGALTITLGTCACLGTGTRRRACGPRASFMAAVMLRARSLVVTRSGMLRCGTFGHRRARTLA